MRHLVVLNLCAVIAFLPGLIALQLPESPIPQVTSELDHILQEARIDFPSFIDGSPLQEQAQSLVTEAQRARIAIAAYIVDSPRSTGTESKLIRAKKLQDELMDRISSHLSTELDQVQRVEEVEWGLHRGFRDGVADTKNALFAEKVLRPEKFKPLEKVADGADFRQKLRILLIRIKAVLRNLDPVQAVRRWRIRRLLNKMSIQPDLPPTPPLSRDERVAIVNPTPWNMDLLRAKLSSITALKSSQSQTASAEARDALATRLIENTPPIQSDVEIESPKAIREEMKNVQKVVNKKLPGADGTRAERQWIHTFNRGPANDWNNILIPGMAR